MINWKDTFTLDGLSYRQIEDDFSKGINRNLTTALFLTTVKENMNRYESEEDKNLIDIDLTED